MRKISRRQHNKWLKICKDYTKCDGYEAMMNDNTKTRYNLHHRFGTIIKVETLKKNQHV